MSWFEIIDFECAGFVGDGALGGIGNVHARARQVGVGLSIDYPALYGGLSDGDGGEEKGEYCEEGFHKGREMLLLMKLSYELLERFSR